MKIGSKVFLNTISQITARGVVILASLLTTAVLTRLVGASGYGDYIFITSFVLIFVSLSDLGVTTIAVRETAKKRGEAKIIFSNVFSLRLFISFGLFLLLNLAIFSLPQFRVLRQPAFLASFVLFFLALRTTAQGVFQSSLRLDLASYLEVLASAFFLLALGGLLGSGKAVSLNWLMAFWLGGAFLSSLLGWFLSQRFISFRLRLSRPVASQLIREALPLGLYLLLYSVYDRGIDSFLLKTYADSAAVGYYGLAYKIHGNLILGAAFLMNSLFPVISSLEPGTAPLKKAFEKTFTILLLAGAGILVGGLVLAPLVIKMIAGSSFSPSILILRILLGATFLAYLNHLAGYLMIATGRQKELFSFSLVALALNLVLNLLFIPRYSFLAAAAVTVLTELSVFLLTQRFLRRELSLRYSLSSLTENLKSILLKKQKYFQEL